MEDDKSEKHLQMQLFVFFLSNIDNFDPRNLICRHFFISKIETSSE